MTLAEGALLAEAVVAVAEGLCAAGGVRGNAAATDDGGEAAGRAGEAPGEEAASGGGPDDAVGFADGSGGGPFCIFGVAAGLTG